MTDQPSPRLGSVKTAAAALNQLPFAVAALEGPDLRLVVVSEAMQRLFTVRELSAQPLRELIPELLGSTLLERIEEVYRTQQVFYGRGWRIAIPQQDGQFDEHYLNLTFAPWYHEDGRLRGVIVAADQVTDLVEARRGAERRAENLRLQYLHTRDILGSLQGAMLPRGLPILPEVELAARYVLAEVDDAAGGDWYDAIALDDGRVALVVGDVVGHGIDASSRMARLATLLQAAILDGPADPAEAIEKLDRFASRVPGAAATTVCLVILDPATGRLSYCTAGHPPPLVVRDGADRGHYLPTTQDPPIRTGGEYHSREARLERGDLLLLYTDGLIERPGRDVLQSTLELVSAAAHAAADTAFQQSGPERLPDRATGQVVELLTRVTGYSDDITILAAHRAAPVEPFHRAGVAVPQIVPDWRMDLDAWLRTLGVDLTTSIAIQHAVVEAVTNSIVHAYADTAPGPVAVDALLDPTGVLEAVVADHGRWVVPSPSRAETGGRGLPLAGALVEELRIDHDAEGTVVTIRHPVRRPAEFGAEFGARRGVEITIPEFELLQDGQRVVVSGPLDTVTSAELNRVLRHVAGHSTQHLTVDLDGVTHLASSGVQVLFDALERSRLDGQGLTLHASPGTPAHHVLELTRLPYS
ncbi:serine phosphatase RsbU (regulator of sigma subunit) [Kribbella amoyensis]|uniref:Serine phosphatase RsbU (Regulator of sigma subunit) n=1 Tax=Kribbella amoyensis TaxID=996641 RepID=A0A561BRG0_9ACTN|nr:SpoIIE family protein phosphatase [Kribbella amoyensis]TWD81362.1 serine phosphatase RsbU (regulator of sigma subunit) [Kribbella amoyensis]